MNLQIRQLPAKICQYGKILKLWFDLYFFFENYAIHFFWEIPKKHIKPEKCPVTKTSSSLEISKADIHEVWVDKFKLDLPISNKVIVESKKE